MSGEQNSPARNTLTEQGPMVYSACIVCTAKWFAHEELIECPRCGNKGVLHTRATPPWRDSANSDSVGPRGEKCRAEQEVPNESP